MASSFEIDAREIRKIRGSSKGHTILKRTLIGL